MSRPKYRNPAQRNPTLRPLPAIVLEPPDSPRPVDNPTSPSFPTSSPTRNLKAIPDGCAEHFNRRQHSILAQTVLQARCVESHRIAYYTAFCVATPAILPTFPRAHHHFHFPPSALSWRLQCLKGNFTRTWGFLDLASSCTGHPRHLPSN